MIRIVLGLILGMGGMGMIEYSISADQLSMGIFLTLLGGFIFRMKAAE